MWRNGSTAVVERARPPIPGEAPGGVSSAAEGVPRLARGRALAGVAFLVVLAASVTAFASIEQRDAWMAAHPRVPNLIGQTVAEAAQMVVPLRFGIIVAGHREDPHAPIGVVLAQDPAPGRPLLRRSIVQLTVSEGSGTVPRLRNMPVSDAARRLEAVGLRLGRVSYLNDDAPPDTVLEQFTPPGEQASANAAVGVLVSLGPMEVGAASLPTKTPAAAPRDPGPPLILPMPAHQEGCCRVESASGDGSTHPERERAQVHRQSPDDRGAQPNVHGPEHRDVPAGP
ncbi:MAG TPA: PASTA domain-containing protein [bacterium]|nr:PASTA domain-containing protein [bacterium]